MRNNQFVMARFAITLIAGGGLFLLYRFWKNQSTTISADIREKLPNEKHLDTIPDSFGNYDIDGVSFDTEGVIVSGDDNKHLTNPMKLH